MRLISADIVFPGNTVPVPNGVVAVEDDGIILEVADPATATGKEFLSRPGLPAPERHDGVLCPGFVNAHCHLELSHMKGKVEQKKGLPQFILELVAKRREATPEGIRKAMEEAEAEMMNVGIVAVGDIFNTADTLPVKRKQQLIYHNFSEVFDIDPAKAGEAYDNGTVLADLFSGEPGTGQVSLTPHAPYSVSLDLLSRLNSCAYENGLHLSIHNQETASEDDMFRDGKGELLQLLKAFGMPDSRRWPTGFSSLASTLVHLPKCNNILLVHNTFTTKADVDWALQYSDRLWWCLCPQANLYIENRLPDVTMLAAAVPGRLCLGTDSLASNTSLSILEELITLSAHFPEIPLHDLLTWATRNGAEFFGWKDLGTLEKGRRPGINLITNLAKGKLNSSSEVRRLV